MLGYNALTKVTAYDNMMFIIEYFYTVMVLLVDVNEIGVNCAWFIYFSYLNLLSSLHVYVNKRLL